MLQASHNRSGEITYKRIQPFTAIVGGVSVPYFKYQITIIIYTDDDTKSSGNGSVADRCVLDSIFFGDNTRQAVNRNNGGTTLCATCTPCGCDHCGELIVNENGYRVKKNIYITEHVYPGPGSYIIRVLDPNRNKDVENIPSSEDRPFYLQSLLVITGFTGANSSPEFKYAPIDKACLGQCFYHNPGAFDSDGDSLSYQLTTSKGTDGATVPGYFYPNVGTGSTFKINPVTGLLEWCAPHKIAEYNIAFIVFEWRRNTNGKYEVIGSVLRDMQVLVNGCINNVQPLVQVPPDRCVEAGTLIQTIIKVSDPDTGDVVTLEAESGAFAAPLPIAGLSQTSGTMLPFNNFSYSSDFTWQTTCAHIRYQPYYTTFKVKDNANPALTHFATFAIRVIPPAIKNVSATPQGSSMKVTWDASTCNDAANPLYKYRVYRQNGCLPVEFSSCSVGVPSNSGYELIANLGAQTTSFVDNNKGKGLVVGQNYSYLVTAIYSDSSTTFASTSICSELKRDIPVVTHVDIAATSPSAGVIFVKWVKPITTAGNLDLQVFKGPYKIELKHRDTTTSNFENIFSAAVVSFTDLATSFSHSLQNTFNHQHEYVLRFFSDTTLIGYSQTAGSVFLSAKGSDRTIDLSWNAPTPWSNYLYRIFRRDSGATAYQIIGTSSITSFSDKSAIINQKTYQYYVESEGKYADTTLPRPLINRSQELYARAIDKTAPVSPTVQIEADCNTGNLTISWNDVKQISDDVASYRVFFKPTVEAEWQQVTVVKEGDLLVYKTDGLASIAGCYAVTSTDINGNEGEKSTDFCIDNCPEFELPNIFTPNGDGANDFFMAIKVRQIKEINLSILDRWGNLAFQTNDPYFKWNGVLKQSNEPASDGTFVYVCEVFEWRVNGISKRVLKGTIQLMR